MNMTTPEGTVLFEQATDGRTRITVRPDNPDLYNSSLTCESSHPEEVEIFLKSGVTLGWLADTISRFEDPEYVRGVLKRQLLAYLGRQAFCGKRLLDFGCGRGASTISMAEFLPDTDIVGLELDSKLVGVGREVAANRKIPNIEFLVSPSGDSLPQELGGFDFIMLSAVYEHLLPSERRALLPKLWGMMSVGGVFFVNQTPHRWFPYEHHSTGLWGINYLPDQMAHWYARRFSRKDPRINHSMDWNTHLRGGLRGGTEGEIVSLLIAGSESKAALLQPTAGGYRDRADYWLAATSPRFRLAKRGSATLFRICDQLCGSIPAMNIDVAIRKDPQLRVAA